MNAKTAKLLRRVADLQVIRAPQRRHLKTQFLKRLKLKWLTTPRRARRGLRRRLGATLPREE